eukprot:5656770-Karenia_brevis.AAC.1
MSCSVQIPAVPQLSKNFICRISMTWWAIRTTHGTISRTAGPLHGRHTSWVLLLRLRQTEIP